MFLRSINCKEFVLFRFRRQNLIPWSERTLTACYSSFYADFTSHGAENGKGRWRKGRKNDREEKGKEREEWHSNSRNNYFRTWNWLLAILAVSFPVEMVEITRLNSKAKKHMKGDDRVVNWELKQKLEEARWLRFSKKYDECFSLLHECIEIATKSGNELQLTHVYNELADSYFRKGDNETADKVYRSLIDRVNHVHTDWTKDDRTKVFVPISLHMSQIQARLGDNIEAEKGFIYCIEEQKKVVEDLYQKTEGPGILGVVEKTPAIMPEYAEALALLGMSYESYALFLLSLPVGREQESEEMMDRSCHVALKLYNTKNHRIRIINNYAVEAMTQRRYDLARRYLKSLIELALQSPDYTNQLPGFYCNYAEALFHSGQKEEAVESAKSAVKQAVKASDDALIGYAKQFLRDLENDLKSSAKKDAG